MNKELTKAEEQVMQALWKIEKGFANEIVAAVESEAAYNTVLTVVRILEQKGFVGRISQPGNNLFSIFFHLDAIKKYFLRSLTRILITE